MATQYIPTRPQLRLRDIIPDESPYAVQPAVTEEETLIAIRQTSPNKAPGPDGIPVKVFHFCKDALLPFCKQLFHKALQEGTFPAAWAAGDSFLLLKGGRESKATCSPKDFRLITLLPAVGKIFEKLLLQRLQTFDQQRGHHFTKQHGFTKQHSCLSALLTLTDSIQCSLQKGQVVGAVFLDIAGAFDRVPHDAMLRQLVSRRYPLYLLATLRSYFENRKTRLTYQTAVAISSVKQGTPQGGVLSPYLWNVYLDPLLQNWNNEGVHIQAYADDLAIWTQADNAKDVERLLQTALNSLQTWSAEVELEFQASKCAAITFRYRGISPLLRLWINKEIIPQRTTATYLGVLVDSKMSWQPHLKNQVSKVSQFATRLIPALRALRPLPRTAARQIYVGKVLPTLFYGVLVWGNILQAKLYQKVLHRAIRPFLSAITHTPPSTATQLLPKLANLPPPVMYAFTQMLLTLLNLPHLSHKYLQLWNGNMLTPLQGKGLPMRRMLQGLFDKYPEELQQLLHQHGHAPAMLHRITNSQPMICSLQLKVITTTTARQKQRQRSRLRKGFCCHLHSIKTSTGLAMALRLQAPIKTGLDATYWQQRWHLTNPAVLPAPTLALAAIYRATTRMPCATYYKNHNLPFRIDLTGDQLWHTAIITATFETYWIAVPLLTATWGSRLQLLSFCNGARGPHVNLAALTRRALNATTVSPRRSAFSGNINNRWKDSRPVSDRKALIRHIKTAAKAELNRMLLPAASDNSAVRAFFPSHIHFAAYARTNNLSWALGQLLSGQHPLQQRRHRLGRTTSPLCPVCKSHTQEETIEHFLFHCPAFESTRQCFNNTWNIINAADTPRHLSTPYICPSTGQQVLTHCLLFHCPCAHTCTPAKLRNLDNYVLSTKRFFNATWLV